MGPGWDRTRDPRSAVRHVTECRLWPGIYPAQKQSDLGPYCLKYRLPRFQIGTFCCLHKTPSEYLYNWTYYKMCNVGQLVFDFYSAKNESFSDSFTILGLWVLGLADTHINESNSKLMSPEHFFMVSLQYHCILGLVEIKKTLNPRDKIMRKRCRMHR